MEVYPAAALSRWFNRGGNSVGGENEDWSSGYKGSKPKHFKQRHAIVRRLDKESCLDLGDGTDLLPCDSEGIKDKVKDRTDPVAHLIQSDHFLDALISAIVTLMVEVGRRTLQPNNDPLVEPVPPSYQARAEREGWIALPTKGSLTKLSERLASSKA